MPGTQITIVNINTGAPRTTLTDESGSYRFLALPPGRYSLRAEFPGFEVQSIPDVGLTVGQTATVDFTLQISEIREAITVVPELTPIEPERTQQSNVIVASTIRGLPIDERSYLTFTLLAPGVADADALADQTDYRAVQAAHSGLSFYGSNGRGNNITVDGAEANEAFGGVRPTLTQEAVQEFQINRSNYAAEFGGASGGVINIVSKSGGNQLHGSLFSFFRDDDLDAADPFAVDLGATGLRRIKPPSDRQQYGGTIGFPIRESRTFFFGGFEALNRDESSAVPVLTSLSLFQPTSPQLAAIAQLESGGGGPVQCLTEEPANLVAPAACADILRSRLTSQESTVDLFRANSGVFPFIADSWAFSARLDHAVSDRDQLFVRYNYTDRDEANRNTRALLGYSRSHNIDVLDSTAVGAWTRIFSANATNELRFQWNYRDFNVRPNEANGPEINITGFGFFNRDYTLPALTTENRYEVADNVTVVDGPHRYKLGAQIVVRDIESENHTFFGSRFGFGTLPGALLGPVLGSVPITALQAFDLGMPQFYQAGFGDPLVASTTPYIGIYAQDTWSLGAGLTLNVGVRYEADVLPDPMPTDLNNVAPRFGFSWDPVGDGRTIVRGGYGIFYAPTYYQIPWVVTALNEIDGQRQIAQVLSPLDPVSPFGASGPVNIFRTLMAQGVIGVPETIRPITSGDLAQFGIQVSHTGPRSPLTVLFRHDPNYRSAYSQQASFGIEREIAPDFTASASYIFASTLKIPRARDINLLPRPAGPNGVSEWTAASGCTGPGIFNCFRDPLLCQENLYESSARAFYHGMILDLQKRLTGNFSVAGSYTLSKAIDEVTDFNSDFQANDQTRLHLERALSAFDRRHSVIVYASIESPAGTSERGALGKIFRDFSIAPIFRAHSARPFNLLVGGELNGDRHPTTDRPAYAGRNTGIGPDFWALDLRVSRSVRFDERSSLELMAEAFNVFNRTNFGSVNNTVGPAFAPPFDVSARKDLGPSEPLGYTSVLGPRRIQLGARWSF